MWECKYPELNKFFHDYNWDKVNWKTFKRRYFSWWSKEEAIKKEPNIIKGTHLKKTENWRQCSKCLKFKIWNNFAKKRDKPNNNYRTTDCKACRREIQKQKKQDKNFNNKVRANTRNYRRSERWKKVQEVNRIFYKHNSKNIKIMKENWERQKLSPQKRLQKKKDLIYRLWLREEYWELLESLRHNK